MAENFDTTEDSKEENIPDTPEEASVNEAADEETDTGETLEEEAAADDAGDNEGDDKGEGDDADGKKDDKESSGDGKSSGPSDKKKAFFKKKDKRDEKIAELDDRIKRQMAEFENFRKRTEKEKSAMYDMGARGMLEKILPVVDNFERGLAGVAEDDDSPFAEGMKMVYKQLMTALDEAGVKEIEAIGCEFDPEKHNAVMHIDDDSYGENEIAEVMQKGYMYHDTVVRYSMVKVAN